MARSKVKTPLARGRVLGAALTIVDEEGLSGLSMRRLGRALGVEAMSLYHHVRNKADLLDGVHEQVLARMKVPRPTGDWQEDAARMAFALRDVLRAHANALPIFLARPAVSAGSLAHFERGLRLLVEAGFEPEIALQVFQAIYALVIGHCAFHFGPTDESELAPPSFDPERHPTLFALDLEDYDPETELELGVRALLAGVAPRLR